MLYITYNSKGLNDGAGAQLLRIVSAYLLSKYYKIGYIHTPIDYMTNFGVKQLEEKKEDRTQIDRFNSLFMFHSDDHVKNMNIRIKINDIDEATILNYKNKAISENILLSVTFPIFTINNNKEILNLSHCIDFNWLQTTYTSNKLKICIHIRRGDVLFMETELRYLPNSYYISVMDQLVYILSHTNISYEFHIYTESFTKNINITSDFRSDFNKNLDVIVEPENFDDFKKFNNIVWHINTDPVDSFIDLCNSDILVTSVSAFSYLAGIVNKKSLVIIPKKFVDNVHPPKKEWIVIENNTSILQQYVHINNHLKKCNSNMIQRPIKYVSGGCLGDFIHQLGIIYEISKKTGRKAILYISNTARFNHFPFGIENTFKDTYKLISSQPNIESYHIHNNEDYDINLSSWVVNQPLYVSNWHQMFLNEYKINWCSEKYLNIEYDKQYENKIVICHSTRRFNETIDYHDMIQKLPYKPIFITCLKEEYEYFKNKTGLELEYIYCDTLYKLYTIINSCKLFIGNLSSPLTIAQALIKPRISLLLPIYNHDDNVHMNGLDKLWNNCLFVYSSNDLQKIPEFYKNI